MHVRFSRLFVKQYERADPKIKSAFDKKLELFLMDLSNHQLNDHPLKGKFQGYRSLNVTGDWRDLYLEDRESKRVIFEALGTHSQLYK